MRIFEIVKNGRSWLRSPVFHSHPGEIEKLYCSLTFAEQTLLQKVCRGMPDPEEYMQLHFREYGWNEDLLAQATKYSPLRLRPPVQYFARPWRCYENSFNHAVETGLLYVEGIVVNPAGIQVHAWNSHDGTDVVDYSLPFQHVNRYFGIEFDVHVMEEIGQAPGGILGRLYEEEKKKCP